MLNKKSNLIDPALLKLRHKIDEIDNKLIDLLNQRMDVVDEVAILKRSKGDDIFIRSNREADMMRHIIAKLEDKYPKTHIFSIWRKIIAAANLHEQEVKIGLYNPKQVADYKYLIQQYYSEDFEVESFTNAQELLNKLTAKGLQIAILPPPTAQDFWCESLIGSDVKIFAKIPFIQNNASDLELFCLAIKDVEPSDNDRTLIYLESNDDLSEEKVESALQSYNFMAQCLNARNYADKKQNSLLFDISGYLHNDSEIVNALQKELNTSINILGHYAVI